MKPIGPLMAEHRLIERMVKLMARELENDAARKTANPEFIYSAVDFFRSYADRTHHGKEENILFRRLDGKPLTPEHRKILNTLVAEHVAARENVRKLFEATQRYGRGDLGAVADIVTNLKFLVELYPRHIRKEDVEFFVPAMAYFTDEEQKGMLAEFEEFDRQMIHEKYSRMVEQFEKA